jgi:chromate reductase
MTKLRILGLSGSLRAQSFNTLSLHAAAELLPDDVEIHIADCAEVPLFSADLLEQGLPVAVRRLQDRILAADGVVIASPEYNFSVSGVLKNTLDWLSKANPQPFKNKAAAIVSATTGPLGGARSQYDLRKILGSMEAVVLPKPEVFIGMSGQRFQEGRLVDPATRQLLQQQMATFRGWMLRMRDA